MLRRPKYFLLLLFAAAGYLLAAHVQPTQKPSIIRFTENKNQWESFIKYRAQLDGGALFLQNNRLTYHFYDKDAYRNGHANAKAKPKAVKNSWFHVNFVNANPTASCKPSLPAPDYNNYFIGKDPSHWAGNVKNYGEVVYENIWPGIRLQLIGQDNSMKSNFYVVAGADAGAVQLQYEGVKKIRLNEGRLEITTYINEITEHEPYAFQVIDGEKKEVPCRFSLHKNTLSYEFPAGYDKSRELVIDPVLVFACSSGSTADNFGMTATYDAQGNLYSGGTAFNVGFPVVNAYDPTFNSVVQYGQTDIVITKYDSSGAFLQYSTYLGGAQDADAVNSLIVDDQNNLFAYGATASPDFPTTSGAYDNTFNGGQTLRFYYNGTFFEHGTDIYIAKLSAGGNNLLSSTLIGGSKNDGVNYTVTANLLGSLPPYGPVYQPIYDSLFHNYGDQNRGEIQIDNNGDIIIASSTRSSDFPMVNGFDNTLGGYQDAVVFKMNNTLSTLIWSSFLGGSNMDAGNAINFDNSNTIFVTGGTCSADFPVSPGIYQSTFNGGKTDGYIAKIASNGSTLLTATFIGTNTYDVSHFVQTDKSNNVYVLGQSYGAWPVVNVGYSNPGSSLFISKLDNNLTALQYSTILGNGDTVDLSPSAFLVDYCENVYLSCWGDNILFGSGISNLPLLNATQTSTDGYNFYLMGLERDINSLLYASYFGGGLSHEHVDGGTSRFDKKGIIYQSVCAGCGGHDDFPVTPGAWPTSVYGNDWNQGVDMFGNDNCNNGTFKLDFKLPLAVAQFSSSTAQGCAPLTVQLSNQSIGTHYLWDFGGNDTSSLIYNPVKTFSTPGTYTINLYVVDSSRCNVSDTAQTIITVFAKPNALVSDSLHPCTNTWDFDNQSTISSGTLTYSWDFGDSSTSPNPSDTHTYASGTYPVTFIATSDHGCTDTTSLTVQNILTPDSASGFGVYCQNAVMPAQFNASGGTTYAWSPATGLNNASIANPVATPATSTVYSVTISENDIMGHVCPTTHTLNVTVYPAPDAQANAVIQPCTSTFDFNNTSGITSGTITYDWDFDDGIHSSTASPSHTYSSNGSYTVSLHVTSDHGCLDSLFIPLQTNLTPDFATGGASYCGDSIVPVQLTASGGTSYSWAPAAGLSNASIANPVASPTVSTTYSVTISETDFGGNVCSSVHTMNITVYPTVTANFTYSANACGNTVAFTNSSTGAISTYAWNFGDGLGSSLQNPDHSYTAPGTYPVSLFVQNTFGCTDTITKPLTLAGFNPIGISAAQSICYNQSAQLYASGGLAYSWAPSASLSNSTIANPTASPSVTTIYTVTITTQSTSGQTCYSELSTTVNVAALSSLQLATFANPDTLYEGESSQINSTVSSPFTILWSPPYALSNTHAYDPVATPMHTTTYTAIVADNTGCQYLLDPVTIYVLTRQCDEGLVFVPNTFSPNADGSNDILFVRSNFITDLYFAVYDRWGERVFETNDITKGWDGMFKGMKSDPGVFGYYLKYTCNNGEESFKKGNVTLIR
jgi:gliding motility-associated-like protein